MNMATAAQSHPDSIPALVRAFDVHHAITLYPEWTFAITHLDKRVENRESPRLTKIARKLIGKPLAIHAGAKQVDVDGMLITARWEGWTHHQAKMTGTGGALITGSSSFAKAEQRVDLDIRIEQAITCSAIVAVVRLTDILEPGDKRAPWHARDQYGWRFELLAALKRPITAKGHQGIWRLDGR
jgi:hypothetical protein